MIIFGNVHCPNCELETRMLVELENEKEEFLVLGSKTFLTEEVTSHIECDYCQTDFNIHIIIREQTISAFLTDNEYIEYQEGNKKIEKAQENIGFLLEEKRENSQFHETFTTPYAEHPYGEGKTFTINGKYWDVVKVYKKESNERDTVKRIMNPSFDEYWYELKNKNNQQRWLVVTDDIEHNAVLMQETPFLKESDVQHDVTDTLFQTTKIYEEQVTENLKFEAFQYLSGIRLFVYNKLDEIELDVFDDTIEGTLEIAQEILAEATE